MHWSNTTKKKKRTQQHNNETRRMFRDGESYDSYSRHFFKQFDHEPSPKQLRKITEHEMMWQGNPISVMKTFGTLHCTLCMKERCEIIKAKLEKNNQITNSCNEIHGACRHKPRFHRFVNKGSSADEPSQGKRVNMPSGKKKGKKRFSTDSAETTGSNHSILSPSDSFSTCSTRKQNRRKKFFDLCHKKSSNSTRKFFMCVSLIRIEQIC